MKKQIRRRKAIALVLCLFMMFSITPLSYADEVVADVSAADVSADNVSSVDVTDANSSVDSIVSEIFENDTPAADVEDVVESGTEPDAAEETPAGSEEPATQEPQYDADGNLIVPEEGDGEPVEEVIEGEVPGASCTIENCQCPCHVELTDDMLAEGMEAMECVDPDCACPCHQPQEVKECTCGAEEGQPHDPSCPLYVEVSEEILALYNELMALETQEEIDVFVEALTDEQLNALCEYMLKLQEQKPPYIPETVSVIDAGPFMPPVTVETSWAKKAMGKLKAFSPMALFALDEPTPLADSTRKDVDGLETSKVVKQNGDGSFTITLEAYTTGTVTTEESTIPVDIVLVLDQSQSMNDPISADASTTRQEAMKQAVTQFIAAVGDKYSDKAKHRIAIVTYGTGASNLRSEWTYADNKGVTDLNNAIDDLKDPAWNAYTNVAAGMTNAKTFLNNSNTDESRQKVVIVFTDGVPTKALESLFADQKAFNTDVATDAIKIAKDIKDSGATIYSVGIFGGANPNQTYGDTGFSRISNGTVGSDWSDFSIGNIGDIRSYDVPAGNRFLNYLSTNYAGATEIGIKNFSAKILWIGYIGYTGWEITRNFDRTADADKNYYLTAANADELNALFQTISKQISDHDYLLDGSAVVKDIVTPYFDMPENAGAISVYTADCIGKADGVYKFGQKESSELTANVSGNSVSVTGFDFNANDVSENVKAGTNNDRGRKLIIEFDVTPKDGFLGGNNVPTNGDQSGVYAPIVGSTETMGVVEEFEVPHVNVPIKDVSVTAEDKNIYLLGTLDQDQLMSGVTVKLGDAPAQGETTDNRIELDLSAANYGLEEWQNAFVDITAPTATANTTGKTTAAGEYTDSTTYTVTANVKPSEAAVSTSVGTANDMTGKTGTDTANINVFKPKVTYHDTDVWYGDTAPDYAALDVCKTTVQWKHGETVAVPANMIGDAPTLSYSYALPSEAVAEDNKIATKKDIPVQATVKIDGEIVNGDTTFQHENCEGKTCNVPTGAQFLLHNNTCSLTLTKTGGNTGESNIFNISKDGTQYMTVSVPAGKSITISELPVGNYSAVEDATWSWRFDQATGSVRLSASQSGSNGTINCTNTANNKVKWLNGYADVVTNTSSAISTASDGVLPFGTEKYQVNAQENNSAEAAVAYVLDVIKSTNNDMEEGELDA